MKKMIVIGGPTATGKSDAALALAEILGGEIISADSMQVYKGMDIGTAKPPPADLARVPHHMIDVVEPDYPFNAAVFYNMAKKAVEGIYEKGAVPILAGGTGFYINALLYGGGFGNFEGSSDSQESRGGRYREELYKQSPEYLFCELLKIDPDYAQTTHMNNVKRVVRALEYCHETGEKFSVYNNRCKESRVSVYDFCFFILTRDREKLYGGINLRVDKMISAGLIEEVEALLERGISEKTTSMQGLGYKEVCSYLKGETSRQEAVELIKQGTRRFAKRQITWFKNQTDGRWLDVDSCGCPAAIAREMITDLRKVEDLY